MLVLSSSRHRHLYLERLVDTQATSELAENKIYRALVCLLACMALVATELAVRCLLLPGSPRRCMGLTAPWPC